MGRPLLGHEGLASAACKGGERCELIIGIHVVAGDRGGATMGTALMHRYTTAPIGG